MTEEVEGFFADVAARHPRCFWLDGGGAREWSGRRSMVGWLDDEDVSLTFHAGPREVRRHVAGRDEVVGSDIFEVLEAELAAGAPDDQWFGYLGYAARPDLFPASPDPDLPDAVWMRTSPSHLRFFDHDLAIGQKRQPESAYITPLVPNAIAQRPPVDYAAAFGRVQEHLRAGNSYEVNLTYRLDEVCDLDPLAAYLQLRAVNPAPYAGFLQHDVPGHRAWLLSSSPERYALVTADRVLETKPIKGTTMRGATAEEDEARTCPPRQRPQVPQREPDDRRPATQRPLDGLRPGTVEVPVLMDVESYPSVHQLVSTVRGRLADGVTTVAALRALFPAGSMTGAPKLRTMQIIERGRGDTARRVRRGVRLAGRRRPRRPRRGDPVADHERRRRLPPRHRRRDHRPVRGGGGIRRVALEGRPAAGCTGAQRGGFPATTRSASLTATLSARSWRSWTTIVWSTNPCWTNRVTDGSSPGLATTTAAPAPGTSTGWRGSRSTPTYSPTIEPSERTSGAETMSRPGP